MQKLLFIGSLLCLFLFGCGRQEKSDPPAFVDPYFVPFIAKFEQDELRYHISAKLFDHVSIIKFDNITDDPSALSECKYYDFTRAIIFLPFDKNLTFDQQYRLFLHEIGHCVFNLTHSSDINALMASDFLFNPPNSRQMEDEFFESLPKNSDLPNL